MLIKIAQMLNQLLGFMNGSKTITGIMGMILGYVIYVAQKYGIAPAEPTGLGKDIVDWVVSILLNGGFTLSAVGLGHKMGKV